MAHWEYILGMNRGGVAEVQDFRVRALLSVRYPWDNVWPIIWRGRAEALKA